MLVSAATGLGRHAGSSRSWNVLVTGAAGFIGFHVAATLAAARHNVVGVDNFNDYYDVRLKHVRVFINFYSHHAIALYIIYNRPTLSSLSVSARLSVTYAGIVSKRLNGLSWFLACTVLSTYPTLRFKEIRVSPKWGGGYFPLELCPKLFRHGRSIVLSNT